MCTCVCVCVCVGGGGCVHTCMCSCAWYALPCVLFLYQFLLLRSRAVRRLRAPFVALVVGQVVGVPGSQVCMCVCVCVCIGLGTVCVTHSFFLLVSALKKRDNSVPEVDGEWYYIEMLV